MPDWSYQTMFRPLLFRMQADRARAVTLGSFGLLGRLPGGSLVIRTMGHMESASQLEGTLGQERIAYPIGLCSAVDPERRAQRALSQIGFGFIETGPITVESGLAHNERAKILPEREGILYRGASRMIGVQELEAQLTHEPSPLPLIVRLQALPGSSIEEARAQLTSMIAALKGHAAAYVLDVSNVRSDLAQQISLLSLLIAQCEAVGVAPHVYIRPDQSLDEVDELLERLRGSTAGYRIGSELATDEGTYFIGHEASEPVLLRVQRLRRGTDRRIIASGGIHDPDDALRMTEAGADLLMLDSGLVYAGPGLPKRINEALLYERLREQGEEVKPLPFWQGWGWMALLGIGMIIGGILALLVAMTSVLLPYDEDFLRVSAGELRDRWPQVIAFMSHDRVTLAGTMISIGILYLLLSVHGLRYGLHWAKTAVTVSCLFGFSSFFLYLGYGYFDPLHATAAAILLPMFILAMRTRGDRVLHEPPNLRRDRAWRMAQWGQLCIVLLGISLSVGGLVIAGVGVTDVFVPQDLAYLCLPADALQQWNAQLLPLIAHDRAGFGGALFSNALALTAVALWGIRQGSRWVWWMLLVGGLPAFVTGFGVHYTIGYTSFTHLLPAYIAAALFIAGLVLLYPYLRKPSVAR